MTQKKYFTFEKYQEFLEVYSILVPILLYSMAKHSLSVKDQIICNFMSRTTMMLKGIFQLWNIKDYQDCWVLLRCMLDRLFHLNELAFKDEFDLFEKWSFVESYKIRNKIRSDNRFKHDIDIPFYKDTDKNKNRYKELSKIDLHWSRPKPEKVAKRMKLDFLYKFGYDYGSTYVHPMAYDGMQDFTTLTNLGEKDKFPEQIVVIHNSCLIAVLILQEAMADSDFLWRKFVHNFFDDIGCFFETGSDKYNISFLKIANFHKRIALENLDDNICKRKS